jgi:hypothetical protein
MIRKGGPAPIFFPACVRFYVAPGIGRDYNARRCTRFVVTPSGVSLLCPYGHTTNKTDSGRST